MGNDNNDNMTSNYSMTTKYKKGVLMDTRKEIVKKVMDGERLVKDICAGLVQNYGTPQKSLDTIIYYAYLAGRGIHG